MTEWKVKLVLITEKQDYEILAETKLAFPYPISIALILGFKTLI